MICRHCGKEITALIKEEIVITHPNGTPISIKATCLICPNCKKDL